jgi:hypothetical protein
VVLLDWARIFFTVKEVRATMEGNDMNDKGLAQRIKESPRTVSALIIILIVAAAIYAFSSPNANQTPSPESAAPVAETTEADNEEEGEEEAIQTRAPEASVSRTSPAVSRAPVAARHTLTPEQLRDQASSLPEASRSDSGYVEVAQAGDGITHLSRRAATRWLAENEAGYDVTDEHRIYIEDYIQNRIGTSQLSIGETHDISFDLVKEAVESAKTLTDAQLTNLGQYTHALH